MAGEVGQVGNGVNGRLGDVHPDALDIESPQLENAREQNPYVLDLKIVRKESKFLLPTRALLFFCYQAVLWVGIQIHTNGDM